MRTFHLVFVVLITALTLAACAGPATPQAPVVEQTTLTIAGSGSAASVLNYLAEEYGKRHSELSFEFLSGSSSGGGVKGVLDGTLDLGTLSRPPKDSELASGVEYIAISIDRIVFATSSDLSISELTSQQINDIFLGNTTNWSDVGGSDVPINVFVRDEEESSTQILRKELFGEEAFAAGSVVFTSDGDLRAALSEATNTITFLGYSGIRLSDADVHPLTIDGNDPTNLSADYPYSRPMGVVYLPANAAKLQSFLDFISSPEAFALLAEKGINSPE